MNICDVNRVEASGVIVEEPCWSHTSYNEDFMRFCLAVKRLSGIKDRLPVIASAFTLRENAQKDMRICVRGQIRSYNEYREKGAHLKLYLFVKEIGKEQENTDKNTVTLEGYVCKKPVYRITPFGREIADLLIAVNRSYGKSDYIPAIAWGNNARFAEKLSVGQKLRVEGRFQSRSYEKVLADGKKETRTAYEVSVCSIYIVL